jgi:rhodanese-related sulfurtransferase
MSHYNIINAKNLLSVDPKKAVFLDVRTAMEHSEKRLKYPHQHIVIDKANPENFAQQCSIDKDAEIYVLCRGGGRAKIAAYQLASQGYTNVSVVEGGIIACEDCGLEIEGSEIQKPSYCASFKISIPLERQVRIVAGLFVFIGSVLALIFSPSFALIPLFVGAGLVFAGLTDQCAMALVLTKAPWNKSKK